MFFVFIFLLLHSLEFMRFDILFDILPFEYVWDDDDDERARFKR